jgi:hypothetical protein
MSIEAMKQALDALEEYGTHYARHEDDYIKAITALRQAIEQAEKQEPVIGTKTWFEDGKMVTQHLYASDISAERVDETAKRKHEFEEMVEKGTKAWAGTPDGWVDDLRGGVEAVAWMWKDGTLTSDPDFADGTWTPLFTAPPKREWVGLTDEDYSKEKISTRCFIAGAKWAEAKLKEKNT